jgi:hypothetical protein
VDGPIPDEIVYPSRGVGHADVTNERKHIREDWNGAPNYGRREYRFMPIRFIVATRWRREIFFSLFSGEIQLGDCAHFNRTLSISGREPFVLSL